MRVIAQSCPSCGGRYDGPITSGILTCEYCGSRFALDTDELEGLDLSEDVGYDDVEYEELPPMFDFAREACQNFVNMVGDTDFKSSQSILNTLGIDDYEEVFLIHDDTIFKSGKNGFGITDYGLYCREMGGSDTNYLRWGDFADCNKPVIDGSYIKVNGMPIAYYTGNDVTRQELHSLYKKLRKHARKFEWTD